jgi:23S rRNA (adenine2503-C2)-methyltransferase
MPTVSRIASLKALIAACRRYPLPPHRRLTFEYVLLAGVNDQPADAQRLVKLLSGIKSKVNLIPFNEFPLSRFHCPTESDVLQFQSALRKAGLDAFIRKSRGRDVLGACGQLGNLKAAEGESIALTHIQPRC